MPVPVTEQVKQYLKQKQAFLRKRERLAEVPK
jgi:hypothetical protein